MYYFHLRWKNDGARPMAGSVVTGAGILGCAMTNLCCWRSSDAFLILFRRSPIHGTGGFAGTGLTKGTRVIEYVGERIDKRESLSRCEANNEYIFALNDEQDLDGSVEWNLARFINHSCAPNCDAELEGGRIWIVANRDITAGEEITFNYGFDLEDYKSHPCRCASSDCVGFMVGEQFFEHVRKQRGELPGAG